MTMIAINSNNTVSVSQSADDVAADLRGVVGQCLRKTAPSDYPAMLPLAVAHSADARATITLDGADGAAQREAMWDELAEMLQGLGAGAAGVCQLGWVPAAGPRSSVGPSVTSLADRQEVVIMVAVDRQGGRVARLGLVARRPKHPPRISGWVVLPFADVGGAASLALIHGVYPPSDKVGQAASSDLRAEAAAERRIRWQ
jgi:hypothetical protein